VYGDDYHLVPRDPGLADAIADLAAQGDRVVIYSNGPSARDAGVDLHVQKVLRRLGCDDALVDHLRGETYDLQMSVAAGAGKPTPAGMQNFIRDLNVETAGSTLYDDSLKALFTARAAGIKGEWVWRNAAPPPAHDAETARQQGIPVVENLTARLQALKIC
jgi:FMN phosphatase YigB (HAD superfamily)